jgi:hypothetical protein
MNRIARHFPAPGLTFGLSLALCLSIACVAAFAAKESARDIESRYQRERASCVDGHSQQAPEPCLREAQAARAQAQRQGLDEAGTDYGANAVLRCARLDEAMRADCEARMRGQGTTSGSVGGGGIYRELITREPAADGAARGAVPPAASPMPTPPSTGRPGDSPRP